MTGAPLLSCNFIQVKVMSNIRLRTAKSLGNGIVVSSNSSHYKATRHNFHRPLTFLIIVLLSQKEIIIISGLSINPNNAVAG